MGRLSRLVFSFSTRMPDIFEGFGDVHREESNTLVTGVIQCAQNGILHL